VSHFTRRVHISGRIFDGGLIVRVAEETFTMALTESRLRQIIREEARRVMNESIEGSRMTLGGLIRSLRSIGEDRFADRLERSSHDRTSGLRFRFNRQDGGAQAYFVSPRGTSQWFDDIPADITKKLGIAFDYSSDD